MGGRLGSLGLYPFMYRGLVSGDLFNDDLEDGYYTINIDSMAVTNNPCGYGVLIKKTGNFNYSTMEVADILNNVKYMTVRNNRDTWKPWRQE